MLKKVVFIIASLLTFFVTSLVSVQAKQFEHEPECVLVGRLSSRNIYSCKSYDPVTLPQDRLGGYTFVEVTGQMVIYDVDGEKDFQIASDQKIPGSINTTSGEVYGFYSITSSDGVKVYFPADRCNTVFEGAKRFTGCYMFGVTTSILPSSQQGGYLFSQVTGMRFQANGSGGFDANIIAPDQGTTGSLYTKGPMANHVAGFYSMIGYNENVIKSFATFGPFDGNLHGLFQRIRILNDVLFFKIQ